MDAVASAIAEIHVIYATISTSTSMATGLVVPRKKTIANVRLFKHFRPMEKEFRNSSISVPLPLLWMPTPVLAEGVVLEDAAEILDTKAAAARSLLTKVFTQAKVRSVLLTLLLICHVTAASLILTAHTDSVLSPCVLPPLTSPH